MDGQCCDRHPSAWAKAKVLLPSLNVLYWCSHCANAFEAEYQGEFYITYEAVNV